MPENDPILDERDRYWRAVVARVRRALSDDGRSMSEIARRVGYSEGYLRQVRSGHRDPSAGLIFRLFGVLKMELADLTPEKLL